MEITEQCVVALTWVLKDTLGEELDVLDDPVEFLVGGDDLLGRIDQALQGHGVGAELSLHLEPEEAFGDYQDKLLFLEPRQLFPADIEEGMTFEGTALPQGVNPDAPRDAGGGWRAFSCFGPPAGQRTHGGCPRWRAAPGPGGAH